MLSFILKKQTSTIVADTTFKGYDETKPWIRTIINHFWFSCGSCKRDFPAFKEKLVSVLNQIKNTHCWEDH